MEEQKEDILSSWVIIIIAFIIFWPIGIFLLWRKISSNKKVAMKSGRAITVIGWVLAILGALGFAGTMTDEYKDGGTIITTLIFITGGIGLIYLGRKTKKQAKKYRKYIAIIVNQNETNVHTIASIAGIEYEKVKKDLEEMIDKGFFQNAYIDARKDEIIVHSKSDVAAQSNQQFKVVKCSNCSAVNKVITGKVGECEYCGSLING